MPGELPYGSGVNASPRSKRWLQGKTVLLTGATRGIGHAAADQLARAGASLLLLCRDAGRAQQTRDELIRATGNQEVRVVLADLSRLSTVHRFLEEEAPRLGALDVLINNAGVYTEGVRRTEEGLEEMFTVNYLAPFLLTQGLLGALTQAESPRVINVVSRAYRRGDANFERQAADKARGGMPGYATSKLALVAYTCDLAERFSDAPLVAQAVHPGAVRTGMWEMSSFAGRLTRSMAYPFLGPASLGAEAILERTRPGLGGPYYGRMEPQPVVGPAAEPAFRARLREFSRRLLAERSKPSAYSASA